MTTQASRRAESKKNLGKEYRRLKKQLGRIPTSTEFFTLPDNNLSVVVRHFGTWNNFVRSLGEIPYAQGNWQKIPEGLRAERKALKRVLTLKERRQKKKEWRQKYIEGATVQFYRCKKQLGKVPTKREFKKKGTFNDSTLIKMFGTWNNFVRSLGEKPFYRDQPWRQSQFQGVPDKQIIKGVTAEFYRLKRKLVRNPSGEDFEKLGPYRQGSLRRIFGTWNKFVLSLGETPYPRGRKGRKRSSN
jgi:hypothetical protein